MRVKSGECRMPIGACSEYRDKDCGRFCYFNTVEVQTNYEKLISKTPEEMAEFFKVHCCPYELSGAKNWECKADCKQCWLEWLAGLSKGGNSK